jgi:hypothetical protein
MLAMLKLYSWACTYAARRCGRGAHLTRERAPPKRARDIVADCSLSHSVAGTFYDAKYLAFGHSADLRHRRERLSLSQSELGDLCVTIASQHHHHTIRLPTPIAH